MADQDLGQKTTTTTIDDTDLIYLARTADIDRAITGLNAITSIISRFPTTTTAFSGLGLGTGIGPVLELLHLKSTAGINQLFEDTASGVDETRYSFQHASGTFSGFLISDDGLSANPWFRVSRTALLIDDIFWRADRHCFSTSAGIRNATVRGSALSLGLLDPRADTAFDANVTNKYNALPTATTVEMGNWSSIPPGAISHDSDLDITMVRDQGRLRGVITSMDIAKVTVSQSPYDILISQRMVIKTDTGTMTMNLPLISDLGGLNAPYIIHNNTTGTITLSTSGSDIIDDTTVSGNVTHVLIGNDAEWHTISAS